MPALACCVDSAVSSPPAYAFPQDSSLPPPAEDPSFLSSSVGVPPPTNPTIFTTTTTTTTSAAPSSPPLVQSFSNMPYLVAASPCCLTAATERKNLPTEETPQTWRCLRNVINQPHRLFWFTADLSKRSEHAGLRSSNQEIETTGENSSLRKIYKYAGLEELPAPLLRFGPVYYDASNPLDSAKEEAWKHLLDKFPNRDQDRDQKTEDIYLDAFGRVEEEARACYAGATLDGLIESQFQWMMIKDGCFFLQLVLFIVGASKELGYPDDHITFGTKQEGRKVVHEWIKCMFHVGNQIPLVVLNEFMKQDFFQDIIVKHGKWERPTDLLSKKLLYDLLVLPAILYANGHRASSSIQCEVSGNSYLSEHEKQPSDLLHGLQNLVLGPKISRNDSNAEEEDDDKEEEGGPDDLEAGAAASTDHEVSNAGNDSEELCVSALRRKGIYFWKSNGDGIRGIQFKNRMPFPGLYLPTVPLNQETELLFRNLKNYEMCQVQNEVRSFLGLMNKLISTQEDIQHLASKGILQVSRPRYGVKFVKLLQNLSETVTNRDHRHVLQQLRDHSSDFRCAKFKKVMVLVSNMRALPLLSGQNAEVSTPIFFYLTHFVETFSLSLLQ